ncbi:secreted protein-like protein [Leptotrombidium deliense]|uniref:Secreted protein-like protein n=1 Tax=Leptotrombidium deliense TaxID=299467 RepID=A0A443S0R8_9ACAR|nr:secreted protein-like protein [Leptotrombidium deliense]
MFKLSVVLVALISVAYGQNIGCKSPSTYVGKYVGESHECVGLVKALCDNMVNFATPNWVRGQNVKDNCKTISKWTAVATFTAPNNKYKGHAAIFESCDVDGVWVYDQWNGQPVHRRKMKFGNTNNYPSNDGSALYTIRR